MVNISRIIKHFVGTFDKIENYKKFPIVLLVYNFILLGQKRCIFKVL